MDARHLDGLVEAAGHHEAGRARRVEGDVPHHGAVERDVLLHLRLGQVDLGQWRQSIATVNRARPMKND